MIPDPGPCEGLVTGRGAVQKENQAEYDDEYRQLSERSLRSSWHRKMFTALCWSCLLRTRLRKICLRCQHRATEVGWQRTGVLAAECRLPGNTRVPGSTVHLTEQTEEMNAPRHCCSVMSSRNTCCLSLKERKFRHGRACSEFMASRRSYKHSFDPELWL